MLLSDIFLLISYCEENEISRGTFEMSALPLPNLGKIFLDWRKYIVQQFDTHGRDRGQQRHG